LPAIARFAKLRWRALAWDLWFGAVMMAHSKEWRRACYSPDNWYEG
jgi:hypothetical protein